MNWTEIRSTRRHTAAASQIQENAGTGPSATA
ncbi:hypothetical protein P606_18675 [Comamonas thiooxydans]|nr:hypothetical protein P606_18675 [Comamonas thiooxydans]